MVFLLKTYYCAVIKQTALLEEQQGFLKLLYLCIPLAENGKIEFLFALYFNPIFKVPAYTG